MAPSGIFKSIFKSLSHLCFQHHIYSDSDPPSCPPLMQTLVIIRTSRNISPAQDPLRNHTCKGPLLSNIFPGLGALGLQCFPGGTDSKESACKAGDLGSTPRSGRSTGRRKWQPTPVSLPGKFYGQRSLVGYSPWGCEVTHH